MYREECIDVTPVHLLIVLHTLAICCFCLSCWRGFIHYDDDYYDYMEPVGS